MPFSCYKSSLYIFFITKVVHIYSYIIKVAHLYTYHYKSSSKEKVNFQLHFLFFIFFKNLCRYDPTSKVWSIFYSFHTWFFFDFFIWRLTWVFNIFLIDLFVYYYCYYYDLSFIYLFHLLLSFFNIKIWEIIKKKMWLK